MIFAVDDFSPAVFAAAFAFLVVSLGLIGLYRWLNRAFGRSTYRELRHFFGRDWEHLETHDKQFPGFDLASVSRALKSFQEDSCATSTDVGAVFPHLSTMRLLFDALGTAHGKTMKPATTTYQRIPVDVGVEESFPNNNLSLAVLRPRRAANDWPSCYPPWAHRTAGTWTRSTLHDNTLP